MDQGFMQLFIACAFGFVTALLFARTWLASAVIGFLSVLPFAIFSVYMFTGGVQGKGFDASTLPEGSGSLLNFTVMLSLFFCLAGLASGVFGHALKKAFRS